MNPKWSTFLTPDPALESYPGISPYAYTLNNPIRYVDPTGMFVEETDWKPKVNQDGSTSYIKEKNDNEYTLASQYDLDINIAQTLYSTLAGGEISGENVKAITGSVVMPLDLNSPEGKNSQTRFDQFIYATDHTISLDGWGFLSTEYYSNTKYKDEINGWAKLDIGDQSVSAYYNISLYRPASFKGSTSVILGVSPLRPKPVGVTSTFSDQSNLMFPRYHPDTRSRNGDYHIFIHSSNSGKAMNRLKWKPPEYKY